MDKLSVVIPVYNEEGNLAELYRRLTALNLPLEIIMVDDGSTDGSLEAMQKLPGVKVISFSRNFGHMIALTAGLDHATGDAVITMDADLQHPPELIPELVRRWEAGAEVVNTVRKSTLGVSWLKGWAAGVFYRMAKLPANAADFRLLDRKVVEVLKQVRERSRFLRGLINWVGFRQEFIPYQADKRFAGRVKYSFGRMFSFALDGITSFSAFPLRLAGYMGLLIAFLSFLYILYALYIRVFTNEAISGWASVLIAVLFIGGIQLIFLGVLGEYLGRVYDETKQRPLYIVSKKIGF